MRYLREEDDFENEGPACIYDESGYEMYERNKDHSDDLDEFHDYNLARQYDAMCDNYHEEESRRREEELEDLNRDDSDLSFLEWLFDLDGDFF